MCARARHSVAVVVLFALLLLAGPVRPGGAAEALDICSLVSSEQLAAVYRKPLYPTPQENGCYWSREPGAMAYLHIGVHDRSQPLRQYFNAQLSATTTLEPILDLGDEGLMSVVEGEIGVVVIRKGDRVLQSAATFLDIKPGSDQQQALWAIYRDVLARM
ncbi:hypothetical protein [uncultured Desulfobulbus sp.]|uniref:hypothetical protein n=1 Tax=uncultured Desulfobulbus sp. TaxID=239745 RepID=UPI0026349D23|nr:hypothetical protein [uncultured Desulfobulbus sp.]